jgi:hypothetical protein
MNQEYVQNIDIELTEQCRKALEKHYGGTIPMPKEIEARSNSEKKSKQHVSVAAFNYIIGSFTPMRLWIAEKNAQSP